MILVDYQEAFIQDEILQGGKPNREWLAKVEAVRKILTGGRRSVAILPGDFGHPLHDLPIGLGA